MKSLTIPLMLAMSMWLSGCTINQQKTAYQTLDTTATLVQTSVRILGVLNDSGKLTASQYDRAQAVYIDYQMAMALAIDLAENDMRSFTPAKVLSMANQLISLIESYR